MQMIFYDYYANRSIISVRSHVVLHECILFLLMATFEPQKNKAHDCQNHNAHDQHIYYRVSRQNENLYAPAISTILYLLALYPPLNTAS